MKKRSRVIALAGISSAFTIICITASIYFEPMTLTFSVLSGIFVSLPFTKDYFVGGVLSYVVSSICALFLGGNILLGIPFIVFFGAYSIISYAIEYKLAPRLKNKLLKYSISYVLKLIYFEIAIAIIWFSMSAIIPSLIIFGNEIKLSYLILSLAGIPLFILYDIMMHYVFVSLKYVVNKRVKDVDVIEDSEDIKEGNKKDIFGFDSENDIKDKNDSEKNDYDKTLEDFLKVDDSDKKEN